MPPTDLSHHAAPDPVAAAPGADDPVPRPIRPEAPGTRAPAREARRPVRPAGGGPEAPHTAPGPAPSGQFAVRPTINSSAAR